jgi:hypothetical protein
MVDIEFLDPGPWQTPVPEPGSAVPVRRSGRRDLVLAGAPALLWLAAAVVTFVAPFQLLYALSVREDGLDQHEQADGWGRMGRTGAPFTEHEARYGIVSCTAGGLFLLAAGLALLGIAARRRALRAEAATPSARPRLVSAGLGITGIALLAGTIGSAWLYIQSLHDNITAELNAAGDPGNVQIAPGEPLHASVHLDLGWMFWCTLIGIGCGLVALVLQAVPPPRPPSLPAIGPDPIIEYPPHPLDEVLDTGPQPPHQPIG